MGKWNRFWHIWDEDICGVWTENKLLSRKWLLVTFVVLVAIFADLFGHELGPNTTSILTIIVPTFVAIQGFVDMIKYRNVVRQEKKNGDVQ